MRALHTARRYRLLAEPPFTVSFPSVVYRISVEKITGCPQWALRAVSLSGRPQWSLCHAGENRVWLEWELYARGFEIMHPSAPSLILDALCRAGRAELLQ